MGDVWGTQPQIPLIRSDGYTTLCGPCGQIRFPRIAPPFAPLSSTLSPDGGGHWGLLRPDMLSWIWQAAQQDLQPSRITRPHADFAQPEDSHALICLPRADSAQDPGIGSEFVDFRRKFPIPHGYGDLSTAEKYSILSRSVEAASRISQLPNLPAHLNNLRAFAGSLRPAASGVRNYKNFCDFIGRPAFPVQTDTVLLRGGLFRLWRTFSQYITHVANASILLRHPADWMAPDI